MFFHNVWDHFLRFPQRVPDSPDCRPPAHLALGEPHHIRRAVVTHLAISTPQMRWTLEWPKQRTLAGTRDTAVTVAVGEDRLRIECFRSTLMHARNQLQGMQVRSTREPKPWPLLGP